MQLVNDIFFLHERGTKIGVYTICLCLGATGPLYAGYMLAAGLSWRLFFYVEAAFAGALLLASFFFVEESKYNRVLPAATSPMSDLDGKNSYPQELELTQVPTRKSYAETLKPWDGVDKQAPFFKTMLMPFTYFFVPAVFWVITSFGLYIGLGALAFNYTFPGLITAPPYNWSAVSTPSPLPPLPTRNLENTTTNTPLPPPRQTQASSPSPTSSATSSPPPLPSPATASPLTSPRKTTASAKPRCGSACSSPPCSSPPAA